jgi:hypothetical protein
VTLIDTSAWVEALRKGGHAETRERVRSLILQGCAAWCDLVVVELWNGARGTPERQMLDDLERDVSILETSARVWRRARRLAQRCRERGLTVPSTDLVIAACAFEHGAELLHRDSHFDALEPLRSASDE